VPLPAIPGPGTCNAYIPGGQTIDRYLWTVQWLIANGFYVLIDSHPMGQETTSYNAKEFIDNWKWVWGRFACLPGFDEDMKGRLFIDILNEPDSQGQGWQPRDGKAGAFGGGWGGGGGRSRRQAREAVQCGSRGLPTPCWPAAAAASHNTHPDAGMTELYLGVMDALWEMTPGVPIFFVEGGGQGAYKGAFGL
jgi:hypothetical protein